MDPQTPTRPALHRRSPGARTPSTDDLRPGRDAPRGIAIPDPDPFPGPRPRVLRIEATADARTQSGSPDTNLPAGFLWVGHPRVHGVFLQFDVGTLAPDAEILSAELRLTFTGTYPGSNRVDVGVVRDSWDASTLTWASQPRVVWKGGTRTADGAGEMSWNVLPAVQAWVKGDRPNHGFALRGRDGVLKAIHSLETAGPDEAPRLIVVVGNPEVPGVPPR